MIAQSRWVFLVALSCCAVGYVSAARSQPTAPRAKVAETLRLDANKEDFSRVSRLFVGPHGQIVVPLPQDLSVRWYDSLGKRTGTIGRRGQGPGEFQVLGSAGWIADTLWIHDGGTRRTTLIAPGARFLRTQPVPSLSLVEKPGATPTPLMVGGPAALFADGSAVYSGYATTPGQWRVGRERLVRRSPSGVVTDLPEIPVLEDPRWMITIGDYQTVIPFRVPPQLAGSPDGSRFATMWSNVFGDTGSFTVTLFTAAGEHVFTRAYPFTGTRILQRAIDSALAAIAPDGPPANEGRAPPAGQSLKSAAKSKIPSVHTPAVGITLGLDNTIWIPMRATTDGREVLVLDGRGNPIASVFLPPRTTIRQANINTLWTTQSDADGLASIVRYKVTGIACGAACR